MTQLMPLPERIWIFREDLEDVAEHGDTDIGNITNMKCHYAKDDIEYVLADVAPDQDQGGEAVTKITLTIPGPPLYQQRHRSATIQPDKKTITQTCAAAILAINVARRAGRATKREGVIYPAEDVHTNRLWSIANEKSYIAVETRARARPSFMHNYDPSKADKAAILAAVWDKRPDKPFDEPLQVDITWYYARPKNHYRTGKFAGELKPNAPEWCFVKPDRDNADKIYLDALSGTFWKDDSRCCLGTLAQRYADGEPYTEIIIRTLT